MTNFITFALTINRTRYEWSVVTNFIKSILGKRLTIFFKMSNSTNKISSYNYPHYVITDTFQMTRPLKHGYLTPEIGIGSITRVLVCFFKGNRIHKFRFNFLDIFNTSRKYISFSTILGQVSATRK